MRRRLLFMLVLGIVCLLGASLAMLHLLQRSAGGEGGGGGGSGGSIPGGVAVRELAGLAALLIGFSILLVRTHRQLRTRTGALAEANATLEQRVEARTVEIARRNAEYRAMLDVAADCVVCMDHQGRITEFNRAAEQTFGFERDDVLGRDLAEMLIPPESRDRHRAGLAAFLAGAGGRMVGRRVDVVALRRDGMRFPAEMAVTAVRLGDGPPTFTAYLRDVTESRAADQALRASEWAFRSMFEVSAVGKCESDVASGRYTRVNRKMCEITGYSEQEMLKLTYADITHPDDLAVNTAHRRQFASGAVREYTLEKRYIRKDGRVVWVQACATGLQTPGEAPRRLLAVVQDITDRKLAEERLAESERFARSVVDALREHIAILDADGRIVATNRAWRQFAAGNGCGDSGRCGEGADYLAVCDGAAAAAGDPYSAPAAAGIRAVLSRQRDHFTLEYPCHSAAEQRWFVMNVTRFAGDGPVRVVVSHENVTERRLAEQGLRFQKALLEAQSDASLDGILIVSNARTILSTNRRFREMWGLSQASIDGGRDAIAIRSVLHKLVDPDEFVRRIEHLYEHPEETDHDEIRLIDGRTIDRYSAPILLDGTRVGRVWYFRDITELKRAAELERERAGLKEAVSGMEQVLGVVGHELRTPLAGLRAISEFLLTDAARGTQEFDTFLKGLNEEVVRMSETVNNLLEAARLNSGKARWNFSDFHLHRACSDALESIRPLVDESKLAVTFAVQPPDLRMHGDANAVRRLIVNLATNSRKHTERGRIHVAVNARSDEQGDWIELCVSDTGCGIAPEILVRLGEAFALNSGIVGANHVSGTGLGIAICKAIVAAHGGTLRVESTVGQGTTVTASLRADLTGAITASTVAGKENAQAAA